MTRILDRYIGRQILAATASAVVILTLVFGLGNIFKRALPLLVDDALSLERFAQFILYILPFAIAYTVPWGFLTAVLLIFGRLSADSELIAMRMAGLSMARICRPVFVIAVLLSLLCYWLSVSVSPKAKGEMKQILSGVVQDDPTLLFRRAGALGDQLISAEPDGDDHFKNVRILQLAGIPETKEEEPLRAADREKANNPLRLIFAKGMSLRRPEDGRDAFLLELEEPQFEIRDPAEPRNPFRAATGITMENYPQEISLEKLRRRKEPKANEMTSDEIRRRLADHALEEEKAAEYRTEITKRYSMAFACVAFCMVGIPLGVTAQRRETSIGFALSLGVAITYFAFIFLGETFSDEPGLLPHLLMWAPSILFIGLGGILFFRLNRR